MGSWMLVALLGCPTKPDPTETDTPDDTDIPSVPSTSPPTIPTPPGPDPQPEIQPCSPALALGPEGLAVEVGDSELLAPSGGTGAYLFDLVSGDALVSTPEGVVDAGPTPGPVVIELTDSGCLGAATLEVEVVPPLVALPEFAQVPTNTVFTFEVSGGSGSFECSSPTATLTGCTFTADAVAMDHAVTVTDLNTGVSVVSQIDVVDTVTFDVVGADTVHIPVGATWVPEPIGGSGVLDLAATGPLQVVGNGIEAVGSGWGSVTVTDRFAQVAITVPVAGLVSHTPEPGFAGARALSGQVLPLPDVTGDGLPDVAIGNRELSLEAHQGGGVQIYASTPTGLASTPVWTTSGEDHTDLLGEAMALYDVNADGRLDLLIGADAADHFNSTTGVVEVYFGLVGGLFDLEPSLILSGNPGDRFGTSMTVCDFDGDGFDDLAVGAYNAEDLGAQPVALTQGSVAIFRGTSVGLGNFPDFSVYGTVPDGSGGWVGSPNFFFGARVGSGDFDGDGRCDLVSGSYLTTWLGDTPDNGFLSIFPGTDQNGLVLERTPALVLTDEVDANGQFGRSLAMGDVDGDGKDDLLVGQLRGDGESAVNGGAAHLFYGRDFPADPFMPLTTDMADWSRYDSPNDLMGTFVYLADGDGDGQSDLWLGSPVGELPEGTASRGVVERWDGARVAAAPPQHIATDELPDHIWEGPSENGFFGQAFAPFGDLDSDGLLDLAVIAGREEQRGVDVIEAWYVNGSGPAALDLLNNPSGHEFGQAVAIADLDGDGVDDLVVGGPGDGAVSQNYGTSAGTVTMWPGTAAGSGGAGVPLERSHVMRSGGDRWGEAFTQVDFDGAGGEEFVVSSRSETRPGAYTDPAFANPDGCPAYVAGSTGAMWVYGTAGGLAEQPDFVWFPPDPGDALYHLAAGDFNGDGFGDVAGASLGWGGGGGFGIVQGRPTTAPGQIQVVCDADRFTTDEGGAQLGSSLVAVPDLDGDGCDELAAGAHLMEAGGPNQRGAVWLLWGYGPTCTSATPEVSVFASALPNQFTGSALASGGDVDGDGLSDVVVGSYNRIVNASGKGAFWVIPGSHLLGGTRQSLTGEVLPESPSITPLVPSQGTYIVLGTETGGRFGDALALVPDPQAPGRHQVAVGLERGSVGGVFRAGGVHFYRWEDGVGIAQTPHALVVGETNLPRGELGGRLTHGTIQGREVLAVGAPFSNQAGIDVGTAYLVEIAP